MNILILSTHLNTGGITSYILSLAKGLKEHGHHVYVATSGGNRQEDLIKTGADHLKLNIKTKSELDLRIYTALGKLSRFVREKKIDVIHTQTRVTQVMGTCLSRLTGRTHVTTCHGFFKSRLSRRIFPCWGKAVIAISEPVKNHLSEDLGVAADKISVIPNGIDVSRFSSVDDDGKARKRKELHLDNEPVIGIIARLSDVKGHEFLIKAMQRVVEKIPAAKLLIIGQGREEGYLKNLAGDLNLKAQVLFYPIVNQTEDVLSVLDVFVMPSLQEGLGLSVMEAQAAGLPVVASRVGGIPSLIEDGKTGLLVKPRDIDDLSAAIIKLLEDKSYAQQIGARARVFIEDRFPAGKMVEATEKFYQRMIG